MYGQFPIAMFSLPFGYIFEELLSQGTPFAQKGQRLHLQLSQATVHVAASAAFSTGVAVVSNVCRS